MTLIVWVWNKDALAFASDSIWSVQHEKGMKWYIVNKLFELSEINPIWIAIAWSSDFKWLSLELIIKEFRKSFKNKSYKTLESCLDSFLKYMWNSWYIKWISGNKFIEISTILFMKYMEIERDKITEMIIPNIKSNTTQEELIQMLSTEINKFLHNFYNKISQDWKILSWLEDISEEEIMCFVNGLPDNILWWIYCKKNSDNWCVFKDIITKLIKLNTFHKEVRKWWYSELIFFWFWENDYYPKVMSIELYNKINNTTIYYPNPMVEIKWWFIKPYAQWEDVDSTIWWISKNMEIRICNELQEKLTKNIEKNIITKDQADMMYNLLKDTLEEKREKNYWDLESAARFLSKAELWKIAENFVWIWSMKKRINMDNETIWWPIDVAIVTKFDWFIWIKRKYYFDEKLNYHYFNKL